MKLYTIPVAILLAFSITGCSHYIASFSVDTPDHALTLVLDKPYFWSDWAIALIIQNSQKCQRRYSLESSNEKLPIVDLYPFKSEIFILQQSNRWYAAEIASCNFQVLDREPPNTGKLIGTFQEQNNSYQFFKFFKKT